MLSYRMIYFTYKVRTYAKNVLNMQNVVEKE
jgi:hypothetical protein